MSSKNESTPDSELVNLSVIIENPINEGHPLIMKLPSVRKRNVVFAMQQISNGYKETLFTDSSGDDTLNTNESTSKVHQEEADTMTIPREELEAKLAQNKAEVQAIASGMREEMAVWRESQNAQMAQISVTLASMSAKMEAKFDVIDAKIDSVDKSMNGRIDGVNTAITGINTAISGIQSGISTKLTIFGVIMAVLLAIAGWWFSSNQSTTSPQTQPTTVYVQHPNVAEPPQPKNSSK